MSTHSLVSDEAPHSVYDDIPKSRWSRFKASLEIQGHSGSLKNIDLLPTRPDRRVWSWISYFSYWFSESWAVATWAYGATMVGAGMTIAESIVVVFFSNLIISSVCLLNSRAAAKYHVGFPVLARATYGIYGHYFFVILRAILGIIWGGVQLYYEGQFFSICLRCIFSGWTKIHNTFPESQQTTLQSFLGFFFAFLITIPVLLVHTYKLRHLFTIKSILMPFAGLGMVIWACTMNGGVRSGAVVVSAARGDRYTFAFTVLGQMNAIFGATSALVVTIPDLSRYAANPNSQMLGQLIGLPVAQTICATFGILTTAAVKEYWGELYWNPWDLLNAILDHGYTPKARAGVFFASFAFGFATLATSIACNIIPFAADVTCLMPKYINVVRGQLLCLVVAFAIVPWRIMTSATTFLEFLGGYSIFQGSVVGIMCVDYFLIRWGNLDLKGLYTHDRDAPYFYWYGINWRAVVAFIVGFTLPFPGFVAELAGKTDKIAKGATSMYQMGWLLSITTGAFSYYILAKVFPVPQVEKGEEFEGRARELDMFIEQLDYGDHYWREANDLISEGDMDIDNGFGSPGKNEHSVL